jgi:hypothetical protein
MTSILCATNGADFFSATTVAESQRATWMSTFLSMVGQWAESAIAVFHEKSHEPIVEADAKEDVDGDAPSEEGIVKPGGEGGTVGSTHPED